MQKRTHLIPLWVLASLSFSPEDLGVEMYSNERCLYSATQLPRLVNYEPDLEQLILLGKCLRVYTLVRLSGMRLWLLMGQFGQSSSPGS